MGLGLVCLPRGAAGASGSSGGGAPRGRPRSCLVVSPASSPSRMLEYWYGRPWVARPYYGTIIAGVALGTLITVTAVGLVPARPDPHLCWYWADPYGEHGYWDYCG